MNTKTLSIALTAAAVLAAGSTAFAQTGRYVKDLGMKSPKITAGTVSAKMDNKPYSASYLPRKEGPLSHKHDEEIDSEIKNGFGDCDLVHKAIKDNVKLATSEKFDNAVKNDTGRDPGLTDDYNANGWDKKAEYWEGFCHLWSPAALDPNSALIIAMDRIYANVPFGIGDLKELTTYNYTDSDAIFVGTRNYDKKPAEQELDPVDLLTVFDTAVGHKKDGLVLDIDAGPEVWNQPFNSFKRTSKELKGEAAKGGPAGAKHAYAVKLHADYAKEGDYAYRGDTYLYELNWNMKVWTDAKGNIIGSEFDKDHSDAIPDFAWIPNQKNQSENYKTLEKIAKEGIPVDDIKKFCEGMQGLTKSNFKKNSKALAKLLTEICPVLDQNKLVDYEKSVSTRLGLDFSVVDAALNPDNGNNS